MKKLHIILILFLSLFVITSTAQTVKESYRQYFKRPIPYHIDSTNDSFPKNDISQLQTENKNSSIDRYEIGKSPNAYSVLHNEQRLLFLNEETISMHFGFIPDPATYSEANNNGSLAFTYAQGENLWNPSFDYWQDPVIVNLSEGIIKEPSSVILNSDNSDEIESLYTVFAGPHAQDDNNFTQTLFPSIQINGENYQENNYIWQSENDIARSCMTVVDNEVYIFGQDYLNTGDFGSEQTLKHYKGITEDPSNGFDWEINSISPDWLIDPDEGFAYALYTTWSAWQKDGSIGYMWMIGVTNESYDYGVFQPQVYYTEDKGEIWTSIELNLEDHWVLQDFIEPCQDENGQEGTVKPSFLNGDKAYPGSVDMNGRLHLFSSVYGSTRGDVLNPNDSIWVEPDALGGRLFDFVIDPSGLYDINHVSPIKTKVSTNKFGDLGFNHRIQVTKTTNELIQLVVWADEDFYGTDSLTNPSLYAWLLCKAGFHSDTVNITEGDLYDGFYLYTSMPEYTSITGYDVLIPISSSVDVYEFANNNPMDPITHTYVSIEKFSAWDCLFDGVEQNILKPFFSISQNTPNPFSKQTVIQVETSLEGPQEISIEITDVLGHVVYSKEEIIYSYLEIELNADNFKKGVYFYTICLGEKCETKKMLVE